VICAELAGAPRVATSPTSPTSSTSRPTTLVAAAEAVTAQLTRSTQQRWGALPYSSTPFSPVVDGDVRPTAPWAALAAGAARDVDLLVGHDRDEYSLLAGADADLVQRTSTRTR
jgi:para-nitrobenzyl esterase